MHEIVTSEIPNREIKNKGFAVFYFILYFKFFLFFLFFFWWGNKQDVLWEMRYANGENTGAGFVIFLAL